ncbi:MAG: DUF883 family protein [Thermoanaerobaculia bacterium]
MQDETMPRPAPAEAGGPDQSRSAKAKEFVGDKYATARDSAKKAYGNVREKVSEAEFGETLEDVRTYVRENPGKALLMSVAAGFLIGLLLRRTDDEE